MKIYPDPKYGETARCEGMIIDGEGQFTIVPDGYFFAPFHDRVTDCTFMRFHLVGIGVGFRGKLRCILHVWRHINRMDRVKGK